MTADLRARPAARSPGRSDPASRAPVGSVLVLVAVALTARLNLNLGWFLPRDQVTTTPRHLVDDTLPTLGMAPPGPAGAS